MSAARADTFKTKASLLANGINFDINLFRDLDQEYYENTYGYCITNRSARREHRIPQVIHLENDLVVSVLRRENSPWNLRIENNDVNLYFGNDFNQTVRLPGALPFFGHQLSDGSMSDDVISVSGAVTPGFFFYGDCHYFDKGVPCGFCSLRHARATAGKRMVKRFEPVQITESIQLIQGSKWRPIPMFTNTCGTPETDEETIEHIIEPLRHMHEAQNPKVPNHVLVHPPNDLKLLWEFKKAGVTSIGLNIEIFDRKLFSEICPGKDRYFGYDKWWEALLAAKEVFGEYRAYCGLIWGLEPLDSAMEGMEYILSQGIGLSTNVFHADPGSVLAKHPQPPTEDIMKLSRYESDLFLRYPRAKTIYSVSMRNTLDWEIHQGYLRVTEPSMDSAWQSVQSPASIAVGHA
jgi:bacteriochlorophyllide c C-7(1)-hydroxylase